MRTKDTAYFDEHAQQWDADPMRTELARHVAQAIRTAVPLSRDMHLLEYGCGTGLLSVALQPDVTSLTLADTSVGMLAVLSAKIVSAGFHNMFPVMLDVQKDPLRGRTFDVIASLMALHHIPDTTSILRRFYELLIPGGWLCIADLDTEDGSFHGAELADVHRGFDRAALEALAREAGFTQIAFSTVFVMERPERQFPVFLMTASKDASLPPDQR